LCLGPFNRMLSSRALALLLCLVSLLPAAQRLAAPDTFDGWVNQLTADWSRDPAAAPLGRSLGQR